MNLQALVYQTPKNALVVLERVPQSSGRFAPVWPTPKCVEIFLSKEKVVAIANNLGIQDGYKENSFHKP
jgi:hypothetical protein